MDPLTIMLLGAGIKGAIGLGKSIAGGIQKRRANKALESEAVKYSRPEEYGKMLSIFEQQAGLSELPGQKGIEADLSARTARGTRAVGKYADSPVAAAALTAGLYGQESQAIRDLGVQFADFKNKNMMALAGAHKIGADYSDKAWGYNEFYPDQVRRNQASQKFNAGQQNLWNGLDQFAGAGLDFASAGADAGWFGGGQAGGQAGGQVGAGLGTPGVSPAAVGSPSPTDAYGYYNPNLAGQFVPQFGTPAPTPTPGYNWGKMGSWTPRT